VLTEQYRQNRDGITPHSSLRYKPPSGTRGHPALRLRPSSARAAKEGSV